MKVFISSIGIFILLVWMVAYTGDLGAYNEAQLSLKEISEEISSGASLFLKEEEFAQGIIIFDKKKADLYANEYLKKVGDRSKLFRNSNIKYYMKFEDENNGYCKENLKKIPRIETTIFLESKTDIFKVPFISKFEIKRVSQYELPYYEI